MSVVDGDPVAFRTGQPVAWTFHHATARWFFNAPPATAGHPSPGREQPAAPWTPLPPGVEPTTSLAAAIARRVSCRRFTDAPLSLAELGTLCRLGYGVISRSGPFEQYPDRPVPSGGGLYPLELSVLVRAVSGLCPGVHHFVPAADGLEEIRSIPLPTPLLTHLFMGQPWAADAAAIIVLSAVTARSLGKYGDRGYRYLLFEAGHIMQNVDLVATALGLGAVNLGGFFDEELAALLAIDDEQEIPLYATAVGVPASTDRLTLRAVD
jgi:SagB-type dehydrogenase family enzyme